MSRWSRLVNLFKGARVDADLEDEQRFHLEARIDDLIRAGHSRRDAEAHAARRFGGALQLREASRDAKVLGWLESLVQDLTLGLRLLRKDAIVTGAAVASLGLAIGACLAAFTLVDALMLRPLPVADPERLIYLARGSQTDPQFNSLVSYPLLVRLRDAAPAQLHVFSLSHQSIRQAVLPGAGGREEQVRTQVVSGNAFAVLGIRPALGRLLSPADDRQPGAHPVAVISHGFWTRRFGGQPTIVDRWIEVEQKTYQVVGVTQAGFTGVEPGIITDVWTPNMMGNAAALENPHWNWLRVWGRLAPGVEREAIQPVLQSVLANFERDTREPPPPGVAAPPALEPTPLRLESAANGPSGLRVMFERPLLILSALVGLVLLIASSNLANLLLARSTARAREMALRVAIGAGRRRLIQQVLLESSVLSLLAAALGLLFARLATPLIVAMLARPENPVYLDVGIGWRAAAVAVALAALTAALFGLVPALRAADVAPSSVLAAGGPRHASRTVLLRGLVAAQVAFSLMVLFVAALLLRSFDRLLHVDVGFVPEHLTLFAVETRQTMPPAMARAVQEQLLERVRGVPGVDAASLSGWALFKGWSWGCNFGLPGGGRAQSSCLALSPDFFKTMRIPLLGGRELVARDHGLPADDADPTLPTTALVNEAFARKYLGAAPAVGQRLTWRRGERQASIEVAGLVANAKDESVRAAVGPFVFLPIGGAGGTLQVRTSAESSPLVTTLRDAILAVHPALRVTEVTSQRALLDNTLVRERLLAVLSGFFSLVGLALAAIGLYGVASYTVVRRTREIGIRLALGARAAVVVRSTLADIAAVTVLGVVAGLLGGLFFVRFLRALLFETEVLSVTSLVLPVTVLALVALIATLAPAARAARINPTEALRVD